MKDPGFDLYAVLHVSEDADLDVIKSAYRTLTRKHHPDQHLRNRSQLETRMARINFAWATLRNSETRA